MAFFVEVEMNDYFSCAYCGHQFKLIMGIRRGDKTFCSHKHEVFYKVWEEKYPFPDYPDRATLDQIRNEDS